MQVWQLQELFLQRLLACLNFTLNSEDLFSSYKVKTSDLYDLWQQYKQMRTIEMSEIWPDIYDKGYIHQFQPSSPGLSIKRQ